jgi:hypothetical protein
MRCPSFHLILTSEKDGQLRGRSPSSYSVEAREEDGPWCQVQRIESE